jgi:adenine-specific DNA-methyltransferase
MAQRCIPQDSLRVVRVLDPAAGAGILAAAVVEALLDHNNPPKKISVILYELDQRLIPALRLLAERMRKAAKKKNIALSVSIRQGDFLLSPVAIAQQPMADIIISNPPYFKVNASDPRAKAHPYAVYGQPNIYSLFMAACASLLAPSGRWCFITPRSWTNGLYFKAMRTHIFRCLHIDAMHIFGSRRDHFTEDEILQEAMITWATTKAYSHTDVIVSTSDGSRDIAEAHLLRLPFSQIVGQDEAQEIVLPNNSNITGINGWTSTLATYGLKVSTGPVVAFRAADHISEKPSAKSVPLLWMQHITHMKVSWPINKKREHIIANGKSAWMLVPNNNFVVMRRFSPKEDKRRITAAPYISKSIPGDVLGLENHTNYIYRQGGHLATQETRGIAAYLNSRIVDQYLRTVAGNTQVNATDLRKLPLPPRELIIEIGKIARVGMSLAQIDKIIDRIIDGIMPDINAVGEVQ